MDEHQWYLELYTYIACEQEPPPKRQKTASSQALDYQRFPAEVRNQLYTCTAIPEGLKEVERSYKTVAEGGAITMDVVHRFFLDEISASGRSDLFQKEVGEVTELTEEFLTLVAPWILFKFSTPRALRIFAETFAAHAAVCSNKLELHVEFDFGATFPEEVRKAFASWKESYLPHGHDINAHDIYAEWIEAVKLLPQTTNVHLVFPFFWRDLRSLRGLSKKTGLCKRHVTFQFPRDQGYPTLPDHRFFVAQTIAAVKNMEVSEQSGMNSARRQELVQHGCAGFNVGNWPPDGIMPSFLTVLQIDEPKDQTDEPKNQMVELNKRMKRLLDSKTEFQGKWDCVTAELTAVSAYADALKKFKESITKLERYHEEMKEKAMPISVSELARETTRMLKCQASYDSLLEEYGRYDQHKKGDTAVEGDKKGAAKGKKD